MTAKKIREVLVEYEWLFKQWGIESKRINIKKKLNIFIILFQKRKILNHLYWMTKESLSFLDQDRIEKTFRWLGFIQCGLWLVGKFPIDDLKNHSRPDR